MQSRYLLAAFGLALTLLVPGVSSGATLTFSNPSCSSFQYTDNGAGNATLTCITGTTSPGAPSGCSLTATPSSLPAGGGTVTLSASCSSGSPTSFAWSGGSATGNSASQVIQVASTTTFSVTPSNASGSGNTTSVVVSVASSSATSGKGFCDNYKNVIFMDVPWGGINDTRTNGTPFMSNGVLVAKFTIPAGVGYGFGASGKVQVAEFGDPPTWRQASLSTEPCDFRGVANGSKDPFVRDVTGATAFPLQWATGNTAVAEFTVTGTAFFKPQLQPGQTYYLNVRNWNPWGNGGSGAVSCNGPTCNAIISINTP